MPKFEVGDRLSGRNSPDCDYSFIVHEIEEDLETKQPVYVAESGTCFLEVNCRRTRKVKKSADSIKIENTIELVKINWGDK